MLGSPLLGTAVGLVLLFATTSLLCSGVTETISNVVQLRAKYLLSGMRAMLDAPERDAAGSAKLAYSGKKAKGALDGRVKDRSKTASAALLVRAALAKPPTLDRHRPLDLTTALFDGPILRSLQSRRIGFGWAGPLRNPQYVSGRTFVRALVDLLVPADPGNPVPAAEMIGKLRTAVADLPALQPVRTPLLAFLAGAGTDISSFEDAVEQ